MNQKGFASIVLIILIVALVGIGGYFAFTKLNPRQQQLPPAQTSRQNSPKPLTLEECKNIYWKGGA